MTDPDGLWVESEYEDRGELKQKILVSWLFILAVRTGGAFESKRVNWIY